MHARTHTHTHTHTPVAAGDVVELPVGGVIRKKTSNEGRSADMARLQAFGDLMGMNQVRVHTYLHIRTHIWGNTHTVHTHTLQHVRVCCVCV